MMKGSGWPVVAKRGRSPKGPDEFSFVCSRHRIRIRRGAVSESIPISLFFLSLVCLRHRLRQPVSLFSIIPTYCMFPFSSFTFSQKLQQQ